MRHILSILALLIFVASVNAQTKKEIKIRNKKHKTFSKELSSFKYIPSGNFIMGSSDKLLTENETPARSVDIHSFFMMDSEVSNLDYQSFLFDRKQTDSAAAKGLLPDTLVWRNSGSHNSTYVDYYFRHPAYHNYPVVGVSFNQAQAFAEWMTEKYHERPQEDRAFKKVRFRLPTEEEWEFAARGDLKLSPFPWGGPYMRNAEGQRMANMVYIAQCSIYKDSVCAIGSSASADSIQTQAQPKVRYVSTGMGDYQGIAGNLNNYSDVTAPVISYWPNGYGLYNMTGNVEEMVIRSDMDLSAKNYQGVTKGGSWYDTGYYGMVTTRQFYEGKDSASAERGFRLVMDVVEY
ncbi:MAG: formylglycine-generating enzyme family protein [bacterium]|nr:formylglycine-generating enzyme family protein [bacterium]